MPLTAEDVRNKQFGTVRFKEGYRLDEVDAFLDEVEAQIALLVSENEALRLRLESISNAGAPNLEDRTAPIPVPPAVAPAVAPQQTPAPVPLPPVPVVPAAVTPLAPPPATAAPVEMPTPASAALVPANDPTQEMVGLLALAKRTADAHIAEADEQAQTIIDRAREEADAIAAESEEQRTVLERRIEELRAFEREYRNRLRAYLEGQLSELEAGAEFAAPVAIATERAARPEGAAAVTSAAATALAAASRPAAPATAPSRLTITSGEAELDHTGPIPALQPFAPAEVAAPSVPTGSGLPAPTAAGLMAPPTGAPSPAPVFGLSSVTPQGEAADEVKVEVADVDVVTEVVEDIGENVDTEVVEAPSASTAPKFVSPYSQSVDGA